MKRPGSSESSGGLMSICQDSTGEHNQVYSREFQSMLEGLDEEGCVEESGHVPEKKRRLSVDQVKALERNFEVENKLEPERKVKLAQELGLQPRQVAVWFQNRRARWKTKNLERDYGLLKANFDALKHNFDKLKHEKEALLQEIGEMKSKLEDDRGESNVPIKEEATASENEDKALDDNHCLEEAKTPVHHMIAEYDIDEQTELNFESFNSNNELKGATLFTDFKDGSSDSDSSTILNEDNNNNLLSPNVANSSSAGMFQSSHEFFISNEGSSTTMSGFRFSYPKGAILEDAHKVYQPQFVKIEEHNFFSTDESCSTFFADDQPPSLFPDRQLIPSSNLPAKTCSDILL